MSTINGSGKNVDAGYRVPGRTKASWKELKRELPKMAKLPYETQHNSSHHVRRMIQQHEVVQAQPCGTSGAAFGPAGRLQNERIKTNESNTNQARPPPRLAMACCTIKVNKKTAQLRKLSACHAQSMIRS